MTRKVLSFLSRISVRLLAFNLLLVFLPVAGFLYLDTYEKQLLKSLEHALVQQARILASTLEDAELSTERATLVLQRLELRHEARLRIVDSTGRLLADSSRLGPKQEAAAVPDRSLKSALPPEEEATGTDREARQSILYKVASLPILFYRDFLSPPGPPLESGDFYSGAESLLGLEIREALLGRYGAATRVSSGGQRSVTLYSAIPIRSGEEVIGAVLVSQSTYRILRDLYDLRLEIFKIFLLSVSAAVLMTLMVATTITGPVRRLRDRAVELVDRRGRLIGQFHYSKRHDEIGDLSRTLQQLTQKLEKHIRFIESFASDITHELKNPLASIRSATEIATDIADPVERGRFLKLIQDEVARMEHLLTGVREISRIDSLLEKETRVRVGLKGLAERVVEAFRIRGNPKNIRCVIDEQWKEENPEARPIAVQVSPERLTQVLENLLENAVSFSPEESRVDITLFRRESEAVIRFEDQGPGIPEENLEKIFDRFVSYRPKREASSAREHLGLGLSIAKAIVEGYDGRITARNREGITGPGSSGRSHGAKYSRGACFEVSLPLA